MLIGHAIGTALTDSIQSPYSRWYMRTYLTMFFGTAAGMSFHYKNLMNRFVVLIILALQQPFTWLVARSWATTLGSRKTRHISTKEASGGYLIGSRWYK